MDWSALPAGPAVFALEDERGATVSVGTSANARRLIRSRLSPRPSDEPPERTRRIDYAAVVRRVLAAPVGSRFEADWAYLQHARERLPHSYRIALDRWRGWFVHCDPAAAFPRFTKTSAPGSPPTGTSGVYLGPLPDKHAAHRCIDAIEAAFDLCRYHHILVQAPHATACAYKEMGRCPAPCDGSITMDQYRAQVRAAIACAGDPVRWREATEEEMSRSSAELEFERAQRLKRRLDDAAALDRPAFALVRPLEEFRFVGVHSAGTNDTARVFLIVGGWIEPVDDLPGDADAAKCAMLIERLRARASSLTAADLSAPRVENIGLVCRHLFHPKSRGARSAGEWLRCDDADASALRRALRRVRRAPDPDPSDDERDQMIDTE